MEFSGGPGELQNRKTVDPKKRRKIPYYPIHFSGFTV